MVTPLAVDLAAARRSQREAGDYIRSARAYPEWLGDVEGAKRGAEDNLMEEVLILAENSSYQKFLRSKRVTVSSTGPSVEPADLHPMLFPFQRDLTRWSIRKGRAAIFADTGLGKTFMQLEWARLVAEGNVLIVAPLSVARQTIREAIKIGSEPVYSRDGTAHPLTITNYEMIEQFNPAEFEAVVLDESSILKGLDGKTRKKLTEMFRGTPYRLCCTATPAPNDIAEIANHAEFLGVMTRVDMLATFFVHDSEGWRLKKHAQDSFYRWLASWGMSIRLPSDLGYEDDGYLLPALNVQPCIVETGARPDGQLFYTGLKGIGERSQVRRKTLAQRVSAAAEMANGGDQWLMWCGLNDESAALARAIPDAAEVKGSDTAEQKAESIEGFQEGRIRVLVTKPRIAGFGMNFQNCHNMAFVGLSDSWEAYYQCIRRCHRFGQDQEVNAYIVLSDAEQPIFDNVMRKEAEANRMRESLVEHVREFEREEIGEHVEQQTYETDCSEGARWALHLGDSCEQMSKIKSGSVGLSVFSPPFMSLYTYSPTERDVGNSATAEEFWSHFGFIIEELLRVTEPGRNCCVHISQIASTLNSDGYIGLKDLRGDCIGAFRERGWIYHGDICIDKNPQVQAIRTHAKGLLFAQLKKDGSWLRPGLADFILVFRKPGDNQVPVKPEITNEEWIEWAHPVWYGIKETDVLNAAVARDNKDERHICPLQLGVIDRCLRLWSNPGDLVCSPFAGIGSEGYMAIKRGRLFVGIELKRSYFDTAARNLRRAEEAADQPMLKFEQVGAAP